MEALLGGLVSLIGAGVNSGWQGEQVAEDVMNQRRQQQNDDRQYNLSTAARTDAYGNEQYYDEALHKWVTKLAPEQQAIIDAQQSEQYKSLTEDALRNRELKQQAYTRAQQAQPEYNRLFAGYQYDQPHSAAADADKIETLLANSDREKANNTAQDQVAQAIRTGQGRNVPIILKAGQDQAGSNFAQDILQGDTQGRQQFAQETSLHNSEYLPQLQELSSIMSQGGGAPQDWSNTPDKLDAIQGQQSDTIMKALQDAATNDNTAAAATGRALGSGGTSIQSGLDNVASLLSKIGGGGKNQSTTASNPLFDLSQVLQSYNMDSGGDGGAGMFSGW